MRSELFGVSATLAARFDLKRFADAQARAVWLHGVRLEALERDDGRPLYVATLHALTRSFRSLPEIEGWLHALDEECAPGGEVSRFMLERTA